MANIKVGSKILIKEEPWEVLKLEHIKVARGGATDKAQLRNILTGSTIQHTFHDISQVQFADIAHVNGEFLYSDGESCYFMNTENFDQFSLLEKKLSDTRLFLIEGSKVIIQEFNGNPINIELEPSVELEVIDTPPGEKGDTATGGKKPAMLTTGLSVQVPLFLKVGDMIRVDTRTKEYLSRV